jgi:hypothetical protein
LSPLGSLTSASLPCARPARRNCPRPAITRVARDAFLAPRGPRVARE